MKPVIHLLKDQRLFLFVLCAFQSRVSFSQSAVTSITTVDTNLAQVTYTNRKGAGLRDATPVLISSWDSAVSNLYTINFNASGTADLTRVTQATITGIGSSADYVPTNSFYRIRRKTNAYITSARNQYNCWMRYSSAPAVGAATGTFNISSPDVSSMESGFASRNINSGYDNVFSNSISFLHAGNVERIDFTLPDGIGPYNITAISESGFIIFDRGAGDPFKIAAFDSLDGSNNPARYLNLLAVTGANFGATNLVPASGYVICYNDSQFYQESRPSTINSQSMRGVFISLSSLGVSSVGKKIYGISIFPNDVNGATNLLDYNSFSNTTGTGAQIDIVNSIQLYRTNLAILPMPLQWTAGKTDRGDVKISFRPPEDRKISEIMLEYSGDNTHFSPLSTFIPGAGVEYTYTHKNPASKTNYYRFYLRYPDGSEEFSRVKLVQMQHFNVSVFPNPATDRVSILFNDETNSSDLSLEMYASDGSRVENLIVSDEIHGLSLDLTHLGKGCYFLILRNRQSNEHNVQALNIIH